ncbi:MAG: adenosine kinase [Actinobacteria bacterium]|nr:adenosine kinase [Actinomycetota bacterium]
MSAQADSSGLDVVAVGSAIVDVLATTSDEFIDDHRLVKGSMALVDLAESDALYGDLPPGVEASGGSAANTAAGLASLGGRAGFVGKVRLDQLGKVFAHDIAAVGVTTSLTEATEGPATARCLVMVTPDAERTMCTYLGAAGTLEADDIDEAFVASGAVVYAEGYLWDAPPAKAALVRAFDAAHAAGRRTAFTLSDPFCVDRFRDEFLTLIDDRVDLVFANRHELCSLFEVDDLDVAIDRAGALSTTWAVTCSEDGSVVFAGGERFDVPAVPVSNVVDTTGAGDLYASGFLFGYTRGWSFTRCGRLGSLAAAEVISHIGARPQIELAELIGAVED